MTRRVSISASADPLDPPDDDPPAVDEVGRLARSVARAERRLRVLEEIGEIGMRLMRKLEDPQAKGAASEAPLPDSAAGFAKLSRAVRLTLDLERRIEEDLRATLAGETTVRAARRETRERLALEADEKRCQDAQNRVADQVGIAIAREVETEKEFEERHAARDERLEWDAAYDELQDRPLREVVEQLCADLELTPDWSDWTDEGWPEPKEIGPDARPHFSPFKRPSPRPILKRTLLKPQPLSPFELAHPPP
jgi:hypothetical protein